VALKINVGIIGAKFAGEFHGECLKEIDDAEVIAVSSRNEQVLESFQERFRIPKGYTDYRSMLEDPDIDVVDICLPNYMHTEVAVEAMKAGKHVICEKPFAVTIEDGKRVVETQKTTGRMFFYAEDWIFAPALVRAKEIIAEGGIGEPLYYRGKECHSGSHSIYAQKLKYCGGGAMIHLAVHPIGFFYSLLGMPEKIMGRCSDGGENNLLHKNFEGEDWGIGILTYKNGVKVSVEGNYITTGGMDSFVEIYGSEGLLRIDLTFGSPITAYSRKGYGYAVEKADFTHGWTKPAVDEHASLGYKNELAHFISCIRGKEKQDEGTTAESGLNILRIILEGIYKSHREGREVGF